MDNEEIKLLDFLLTCGWGNIAGTMFSPKAMWSSMEDEILCKLMTQYDYKYGGIK
jgi:hypothetical protein